MKAREMMVAKSHACPRIRRAVRVPDTTDATRKRRVDRV
jgi:hypothetical protein